MPYTFSPEEQRAGRPSPNGRTSARRNSASSPRTLADKGEDTAVATSPENTVYFLDVG